MCRHVREVRKVMDKYKVYVNTPGGIPIEEVRWQCLLCQLDFVMDDAGPAEPYKVVSYGK